MFHPTLPVQPTTRELTDAFYGYVHKLRIGDGEFYDMTNLTGDEFPLLASRRPRGTVVTGSGEPMGIAAKESPVWIIGNTLYLNGIATGLNDLTVPIITRSATEPSLPADGQYWYNTETGVTKRYSSTASAWTEVTFPGKQIVSMGAYILIFPDRKYINTKKLTDFGSIEAHYTAEATYKLTYTLSDAEGGTIPLDPDEGVGSDEPENPENGQYWVDTSGTRSVLRRWNKGTAEWVEIPTCYVTISKSTESGAGGIGAAFELYDGVTLSGCAADKDSYSPRACAEIDALNGTHTIWAKTDDSITIPGILTEVVTQTMTESVQVKADRVLPDMDYVCEAGNRLWGCRYGLNNDNELVNELYCSALGDFRNWQKYMGLSTDSWAASCGSDGPWTGCVNFFGSPTFFKEDHIHVISISSVGAHQVTDFAGSGVRNGCWRSLAIVRDTLFYKGRSGVMAYQGGIPVSVSDALGDVNYEEAAAGSCGKYYYISMRAPDGWSTFVFDTASGRWYREDDLHAVGFTEKDGDIYALTIDKQVLALRGTAGTLEDTVAWSAESGVLYYERPDRKYVTHYQIRMRLAEDAWAKLEVQYDSNGIWEDQGTVRTTGIDGAVIPIRPRRCDHCAIRISGEGEVRIFGIARIYENGSDWR